MWDKLLSDDKITKSEFDYVLKAWGLAGESESLENKYKIQMLAYVEKVPVYNEFLVQIRGIGPVLAANLIKEFGDCHQYDTISKLWEHCGQGVHNGTAPKRRRGEEINYNPKLKTLVWKISDCLLKANNGIYRQIYDTKKEKYLARKYPKEELFNKYGPPYKKEDVKLSKGHAHNMALRKMRKLFLSHYWAAARELAGLETRSPFAEEVGHKNIITWKHALKLEKQKVKKAEKPKKAAKKKK